MKKINFILLSAILIFGISSCKSDEKKAEEAAEEFVEGLLEKVGKQDINIDINDDGETAEMTINGEDGAQITIKNDGNEIPDNFPKDVYLIKGKIESAGTMSSGEGEIITVIIKPELEFKELVSSIEKEMKSNGWKSAMNMNMGSEAMQMYSKDNNSATITVNGKDAEVSYMVTIAKK